MIKTCWVSCSLSRGSESVCKRVSKNGAASYSSPSLGLDHSKLNSHILQVPEVDRPSRTLLTMLFGALAMNERRVIWA
jgi:hypothetical protein